MAGLKGLRRRDHARFRTFKSGSAVLISVTTALRFYGFPPAPPPIRADNSRCACCRRLAGMRSGIREDYGMHTRHIRVRTRCRWRDDIVDDHSGCQISFASRKFLKNGNEYLDFFACRTSRICKCGRARCDECKDKCTLFDGAVSLAFYARFRRLRFRYMCMYIYAHDGEGIANTFHASLQRRRFLRSYVCSAYWRNRDSFLIQNENYVKVTRNN